MERVILHYDMDCFYASIETRDNSKKYKNKPMVVAGGVVLQLTMRPENMVSILQ